MDPQLSPSPSSLEDCLSSPGGRLRFTLWRGGARKETTFRSRRPSGRRGRGAALETGVKVCTQRGLGLRLQLGSWQPGLEGLDEMD